ncbi:hypothetical protein [Kutzneria sp. CA-103260]|uniref:hypothetical protein n=1 Tax=Kutzneria sp. CA-103260 TaxID=2802641 RepID=UPI001BAE46BE|nr:hypothetical protein [Kutzneria sp. CA-103260]QUQ64396.1 X-Pro dipeptidyl-peptidase [Kutzneria sp. CA-103260]
MTWFVTRRLRFGDEEVHRVGVQRGLRVPLPAGASLRAHRYFPRGATDVPLVVLTGKLDSCQKDHAPLARAIAARGYQVLVHAAPIDEDERGAVLAWLCDQPWFPGTVTPLPAI